MSKFKHITSIRLYRFQSHADTLIELDKGANAITGPTDSGKSAIIRALYWAFYNRPVGANYVFTGEKHVFVHISYSDGSSIIRGKNGSTNYYIVEKADGTKLEFKGFGTEVPPEVTEIHGMPLINIDESTQVSLNLATQLEPPFLLMESNTKKAKSIGMLNNSDVADYAISDINSEKLDLGKTRKLLGREINAIKDNLEKYDNLHIFKDLIDELQSQLEDYVGVTNLKCGIEQDYNHINNIILQINNLKNILIFKEALNTSTDEFNKLLDVVDNIRDLKNLTISILKTNCDIENLERVVQNKDRLDKIAQQDFPILLNIMGDIKELSAIVASSSKLSRDIESIKKIIANTECLNQLYEAMTLLEIKRQDLIFIANTLDDIDTVIGRINNCRDTIIKYKESTDELVKVYISLLEELEVCPTCGSHYDNHNIENII